MILFAHDKARQLRGVGAAKNLLRRARAGEEGFENFNMRKKKAAPKLISMPPFIRNILRFGMPLLLFVFLHAAADCEHKRYYAAELVAAQAYALAFVIEREALGVGVFKVVDYARVELLARQLLDSL